MAAESKNPYPPTAASVTSGIPQTPSLLLPTAPWCTSKAPSPRRIHASRSRRPAVPSDRCPHLRARPVRRVRQAFRRGVLLQSQVGPCRRIPQTLQEEPLSRPEKRIRDGPNYQSLDGPTSLPHHRRRPLGFPRHHRLQERHRRQRTLRRSRTAKTNVSRPGHLPARRAAPLRNPRRTLGLADQNGRPGQALGEWAYTEDTRKGFPLCPPCPMWLRILVDLQEISDHLLMPLPRQNPLQRQLHLRITPDQIPQLRIRILRLFGFVLGGQARDRGAGHEQLEVVGDLELEVGALEARDHAVEAP